MKVMVATDESQGVRMRDIWHGCVEGELVRPIEERCEVHDEGDCSCETVFVGLASGGLTSTARIAEVRGLSVRQYALLLQGSLTARERSFVRTTPYARELVRVAAALRGSGVIERWDEWIGFRFGDDGELSPDPTTIADIDPAELEGFD